VLIVLISFLLMSGAAITIGIIYWLQYNDIEWLALAGAGIFFLIPTWFVYIQSYAWYTGYYLELDHILLKGVYKKERIPYSMILSVENLNENKVREILEEPMAEAALKARESDLKGWYGANKRYSEIIQYCTVQFAHSSAGGRGYRTERYTGVEGVVSLVGMTLKDGRFLLLSPVDSQAFTENLRSRFV
jgi:hypothetical protein